MSVLHASKSPLLTAVHPYFEPQRSPPPSPVESPPLQKNDQRLWKLGEEPVFKKDATNAVSIFVKETELNRIGPGGTAHNPKFLPLLNTVPLWMINRKSGGKKATLHLLKVR